MYLLKLPWILIAIVLLGGVVRLILTFTTDFWFDEAFSGLAVSYDWQYMWSTLQTDGLHPPLMYVLQKISVDYLGNSELSIRLPALISGIALIPLVYSWVREAHPNPKNGKAINRARLAAALIAINPLLIIYSNEARPYMLLVFLGTAWSYFAYQQIFLRYNRWVILVLVSILMLLTHLFAVFWLIAGWSFMFLWRAQHKTRQLLLAAVPAILVALAIWHIINPQVYQIITRSFGWLPKDVTLYSILDLIYSYIFGVNAQATGFSSAFTSRLGMGTWFVGSIILVALGWSIVRLKRTPITYFLLWMTFIPIIGGIFLSSVTVNLLMARYFLLSAPFLLILLAIQISKTSPHIQFLVLILILGFSFTLKYENNNPNYQQAATNISQQAYKYSKVVSTNPLDFVVLKYYLKQQNTLETINFVVAADLTGQNWATIDKEEEQPQLELNNPNYLVVRL